MKQEKKENDCIELSFTDEEFILISSTFIGMEFFMSGKLRDTDYLLDYRLQKKKILESLKGNKQPYAATALVDEILCSDLLLSLRTYLEEHKPKSPMLIENLMDNNPSQIQR